MIRLNEQFAELRAQLAGSARLRLACWLVLGIVWLYALMWHGDHLQQEQSQLEDLRAELGRLKPLQNPALWESRAKEARSQLEALNSMQWQESTPGLAQAAVQDWLRQVSTKAGLTVRDLRLSTAEAPNASAPIARAPAGVKAGVANPLPGSVRVRLSVDFKPLALAVLLQEMSRNERVMVVERLQFRTWLPSPQAEIDVRARALHVVSEP